MTGGPLAADPGQLTLTTADPIRVERAAHALAAVSARQHHLGPIGAGLNAKVAVNLAVAVSIADVREALVLPGALSVDEDAMRDLLVADSCIARNRLATGATAQHYPRGVAGLTATVMKDQSLAHSIAQRSEIALPDAALATQPARCTRLPAKLAAPAGSSTPRPA
jgi:3-hydroxyisobutyrate dehydrogenase-like beta-hydroxyacid dehydrogenase